MKKIGFVGLGIMGKPMAKNLIKAGYDLIVYDIMQPAVAELVALGAKAASAPKEVAVECDTIITMLPNGPEVREVVTGANGLLQGAKEGCIIIDMSSIAPLVSKEMYNECKKKSVRFVDAPVSGGEPKAIDGTLAIMVGCDVGDFAFCEPILKCVGASVVRTGEIGSGNVTKLANQIIVALNIAALSEALVLATKSGVDPKLIFDAIKGGLAGSTVMNAKTPMILNRNFNPGFKIKLHIKDLANAIETGHQVGVPLPLTTAVMEMMQALKIDGKEENDHAGLIQYFEKLAQIEVKSQE
ncbi:MAG: 2-hydroxy-3-oxopropionate reductase [Bacteroidetes bacterium GWF2_42_66]|nr:MAG: 2-hydroxy-3-oxopropionate reductase [Bacteroidetes bacterium GWA2_42_15]OFX97128.1 MAG: 2-hydroxy-3-oxopropionate reductase [Bacteroidetes bacterium GWE2_42_39]OFY46199.1 MAG: 2-hydroxy-3-oxopropionate reductase [Bacteroidetes bacterium GWF2_42_66]HBL78034.1 2-hydroxy-3-oxopropionate reductase [Prolixibacteraceae bacterium]HCR92066.1 2-hydroxy-3-oxopropionate reductase [Prolixibacteraceae bacterium]